MVGWINQFQDRDQLGAFVIREINFMVLIKLGSLLTMYATISFWRTLYRRVRHILVFSCLLGAIQVFFSQQYFCCTFCSRRSKCTIPVTYTNWPLHSCLCLRPCFRCVMFHGFGTASDEVIAITAFVQIIQVVWENKCGTHAYTQRMCELVFFSFVWRTVKRLKFSKYLDVISGFRRDVDEICVLLGYYAV
jgi:hypothetical protein